MPWRKADVVTLREEFVLKALGKAQSFGELCAEYGISRKTGYKWLGRFREGGLAGLRDVSRRPKTPAGALGEEVVCELIRIKRSVSRTWGPKKVLGLYERRHGTEGAPSLSSVKRVLDKAGFVSHRVRARSAEPRRIQEGLAATTPNELWTVDYKGWWKTRSRERCEPLTIRDSFSRFILDVGALRGTGEGETRTVFERVFSKYGLPDAIRSDNGSPFASATAPLGLSRLSSWWVSLGIRLDRIDPGRPDQNGAHERMHRDIRSELQAFPADDIELSQSVFDDWRHEFNWERPHEALGMRTPGEIYVPSARRYRPEPVDIAYPAGWLERRVASNGSIMLCSNHVFVSTALDGFVLGLQPVSDRLVVWFDYLRIGHLDLDVMRFVPVTKPKKRRRPSSGRPAARRNGQVPESLRSGKESDPKVLPMS